MSEEKVPLRPQIRELELGKSISFPIQRMRTIKTTCSELGVIYCRKFKTKSTGRKRSSQLQEPNKNNSHERSSTNPVCR